MIGASNCMHINVGDLSRVLLLEPIITKLLPVKLWTAFISGCDKYDLKFYISLPLLQQIMTHLSAVLCCIDLAFIWSARLTVQA